MYRSRRRGGHPPGKWCSDGETWEGGRAIQEGSTYRILEPRLICVLLLQLYAGKNRMVSTTMIGSGCGGRKPKAAANYFLSELSIAQWACLLICSYSSLALDWRVDQSTSVTVHSIEFHLYRVHLSAGQMIRSGIALSEEDWQWAVLLPARLPGRDCWAWSGCCYGPRQRTNVSRALGHPPHSPALAHCATLKPCSLIIETACPHSSALTAAVKGSPLYSRWLAAIIQSCRWWWGLLGPVRTLKRETGGCYERRRRGVWAHYWPTAESPTLPHSTTFRHWSDWSKM